jgi:colanic acid/amylovoran biosynthesis glycosyltransferase
MGKPVVASYCSTFLKSEMLHVYRQVASLRRVNTFVMTKKVENASRFPFEDIEIIPRPHTNLLRHGWMKFVERRPPLIYRGEHQLLVSILGRRHADMMHIYFGHTGVHLLPFIREWNRPCVVSFHGFDLAKNPKIENYPGKLRILFDSVPVVLARSRSLADRLIKFGCAPEKIRINRTGIPLGEFPFTPRDPPRDNAWRILQACRLIDKKGVASAIRAFAVFATKFPNAEFVIAGKGPLQPELEALAQRLNVAPKVHFCGFLSQKDLRWLYEHSDIFIHPSETPPDENQEGVPNSILEAMATGLPVIATRHGGIPEAVKENVNGFLSEELDWENLGRSMIALANSPELYMRCARAAREAVAANFDQARTIHDLEQTYEEVISSRSARELAKRNVPAKMSASLIEEAVAK